MVIEEYVCAHCFMYNMLFYVKGIEFVKREPFCTEHDVDTKVFF